MVVGWVFYTHYLKHFECLEKNTIIVSVGLLLISSQNANAKMPCMLHGMKGK